MTPTKTTIAPGDAVAVRQPGQYPEWVPAIIERRDDYHHGRGQHVTTGYYVRYHLATEQWHCSGGWVPASQVHRLEVSR